MRVGSIRIIFILTAFALAATSCVSKGKYEELETDRNQHATREAELSDEVAAMKLANQALAQNLSDSEVEAAAMRGTYDQLLTELEGELATGQIEIQQLVDGIQLNVSDKLLFASGSASLNEAGLEVIRRVAEQIKDGGAVVAVEGHTDDQQIGPALRKQFPTNWELAGARAASVVRQLSEHGVPPAQLRAVSRGPFEPIASNETAEGRAKNRRTEIILRLLPPQ
jgi:chemotaxis protein MotB